MPCTVPPSGVTEVPAYVVLGAQWGDEGKGKVCDYLATRMDLVVRFQGGANAGHTVVVGDRRIVLHHIPSGIWSPRTTCVIGSGCVVDPVSLVQEIDDLAASGIHVTQANLLISPEAHVVTEVHRFLDTHLNAALGTTARGIGPCYADKAQRIGVRVETLRDGTWREAIRAQASRYEGMCRAMGLGFVDVEASVRRLEPAVERLLPLVRDPIPFIHQVVTDGGNILYEGAQGTMLDVDHGTYPYVTSSSTTIGSALCGTGVYVPLDVRIGVVKAYTTRVGAGPFPTELAPPLADHLRRVGHEYGATTGRPRRLGWLDLFLCQRACVINGFNYLVLTKLDCLTGLPTLSVAVGRNADGSPVYQSLQGWEEPIRGITSYHHLPAAARRYVEFVEQFLGVPVGMVSTGPDRGETIVRREP